MRFAGLMLFALATPTLAAELNIKLQVPRLDVAEYHRPYIAVWLENPDQSTAAHLAVWYQTDSRKEDGTQWLKDLRQWWRRGGRELEMPVDGVTGATRPAGVHTLSFKNTDKQLAKLAQAIVHGPRLIILDEPTNGLDPPTRSRMISLIRQIRDGGRARTNRQVCC